MKRFNTMLPFMSFMSASSMILREKPDDGTGNGDDEAAKAAAEKAAQEAAEKEAQEAAALAAAEEAERKAQEEAEAAAEAAKNGTEAEKRLAKEKAELLAEVMEKKTKLREAQDEAKEARDKLAAFGDVDPEKVKALLQAEQDAERAALEAKGEFDRVKEMMATEHSNQIASKDAEIEALKAAAAEKDGVIDKLTIGRSFSDSKFIQDDLILSASKMRALYGDHVGLSDGEVVVYDKPASASDRTIMVDASGKQLSFDEGMKRLVDADPDKDTMIRSKMAPGGRSKSTDPGAGKKKPPQDNGLRGAARIVASLDKSGELK